MYVHSNPCTCRANWSQHTACPWTAPPTCAVEDKAKDPLSKGIDGYVGYFHWPAASELQMACY